jgi:hypothetical protein
MMTRLGFFDGRLRAGERSGAVPGAPANTNGNATTRRTENFGYFVRAGASVSVHRASASNIIFPCVSRVLVLVLPLARMPRLVEHGEALLLQVDELDVEGAVRGDVDVERPDRRRLRR